LSKQILTNLTPVFNFVNILRAIFAMIFFLPKNYKAKESREELYKTLSFEKAAHKMLVKLTPG